MDSSYRVLSIQSYVVHGYVGNKCATFAIQTHGIDADAINTVQLSNNTAYSAWKGKAISPDEILDLYQGICMNNLDNYSHVLTGYVNNIGTLESILYIVKDLLKKNPNLIYVCDPVLGDDGILYKSIPNAMITLYREQVIPVSNIVKMNQTEMEFLTEMKITDDNIAFQAMDKVHSWGPNRVVLSSVSYLKGSVVILGSDHSPEDGTKTRYKMVVPRLKGFFTGTGDLFSSLLLANCTKKSFKEALQYTVSSIQSVLSNSPKSQEVFNEIRLIQSKEALLVPEYLYPIQEL